MDARMYVCMYIYIHTHKKKMHTGKYMHNVINIVAYTYIHMYVYIHMHNGD